MNTKNFDFYLNWIRQQMSRMEAINKTFGPLPKEIKTSIKIIGDTRSAISPLLSAITK